MTIKNLSITTFFFLSLTGFLSAQALDLEKGRHKTMLSQIKGDVKKHYYDPQFKGRDIEADYKAALDKIENATSIGQLSGIVAQFLMDFDDSHLFFIPPSKSNRADYGFSFRMVGEKAFILGVAKDSDAKQKGVEVDDEIYALNDFAPTRENLWKMRYLFFRLRPQPTMKLDLIKPDGKQAQYIVQPRIRSGIPIRDLTGDGFDAYIRESESAYEKATKQYGVEIPGKAFIWRMPSFSIEPSKVDDIMGKAKKFPAVIFDLRGNGGGRVDMVVRLIANIFDRDVKIADEKTRKETKEIIAKGRGKDAFSGKVVVLIDSASASASEVFARVVQIENRGIVVGDRSAGAVMESMYYGNSSGTDTLVFYGSSVTIADLFMKDGKSLEMLGVTPEVWLTPTARDLAAKRDPVMSTALQTIGVQMTPEAARAFFPEEDEDN